MSTAEARKRRGSAKGSVTRANSNLHVQAKIEPHKRDIADLQRIKESLARAEASFLETLDLDEIDYNPETTDENSQQYIEFSDSVRRAFGTVSRLEQEHHASKLHRNLLVELAEWESMDDATLRLSFEDEYARLSLSLSKLREHSGTEGLPDIVGDLSSLRRRLSILKGKCKSDSIPVSPIAAAVSTLDPYTEVKKARTMPLPVFKGDRADWRSFWKRFTNAINRIKDLANDERLTLLLESLKDPEGQAIVSRAIRNGEEYSGVAKLLNECYDQPREVFLEATRQLTSMSKLSHNSVSLTEAIETLANTISTVQQYGDGTVGQMIAALVEAKMDSKVLEDWRIEQPPSVIPDAEALLKFLRKRKGALGSVEREFHYSRPPKQSVPQNKPSPSNSNKGKAVLTLHTVDSVSCSLCHQEHPLHLCSQFRDMDVNSRHKVFSPLKACYNCLRSGHTVRQCPSRYSCKECGQKHHTLLHRSKQRVQTALPTQVIPAAIPSGQPAQPALVAAPSTPTVFTTPAFTSVLGATPPSSSTTTTPYQVYPPTTSLAATLPEKTSLLCSFRAVVEVEGRMVAVRGIFDNGSTISFVTRRIANALQAKQQPWHSSVTGIAGVHAADAMSKVDLLVKPFLTPTSPGVPLSAAVLTDITGDPPTHELSQAQRAFIDSFQLADRDLGKPGRIDILVGQDQAANFLLPGQVVSKDVGLYCNNTVLGWIVGGSCSHPSQAASVHICCLSSLDQDTDKALRAFWEVEEAPSTISTLSPDDQLALDHYKDNTSREEDGRYVVALPRKQPTPTLGSSRPQALRRFLQNRGSLIKKKKWDEFHSAVQEYGTLGHAEPVPAVDLTKPASDCYYLPMHGVTKQSSSTTKLRVVFDASAKTSTGVSLNDTLLAGPSLYPQLTDILIRFRYHRIAMSSDIGKMFREIALHPDDRDYHRFLMQSSSGQLIDWRMTRLTFGVASSPFLATQTLRQLADDYQGEFPEAAQVVRSCFYVDDCLTGTDNLQHAQQLRSALNTLLSRGGMNLRKWRSNSSKLLSTIPGELREAEPVRLITAPSEHQKTLGLHWRTEKDTLHVATPTFQAAAPTKRQILSDVAQTFDVMGWFAPVTVTLKILLQKLWSLNLGWDDDVPSDISEVWTSWRKQLSKITDTPVPRCYFNILKKLKHTQLHGFADGSEAAYAGVVYIRATYSDGSVTTALVLAKSKVAPLKPITIPRLELLAALLTSRLLDTVRRVLEIPISDVFAWSDSTVVLHWLKIPPHKLKCFVANRVTAITEILSSDRWRHLPSADNPADIPSRGMPLPQLLQSQLWWDGPQWLKIPMDTWPSQAIDVTPAAIPEIKSHALLIRKEIKQDFLVVRYSDYNMLLCVVAWSRRFISNCRKAPGERDLNPHLDVQEIQAAETLLVRLHQETHFSKELADLKRDAHVGRDSRLAHLTPFLDSSGLIRIGGRLKAAGLPFSQTHPPVLSKGTGLARCIVTFLHSFHRHPGPTHMMGLLAGRFHIIGARNLIRDVSRKCVTCQRNYARTEHQQMGQLPPARVKPSSPFSETGVDFAGPVTLRRGHTRKPSYTKAYVALFICLATKAVHLELVEGLSTADFISTLRRFIARRGCPQVIYSDNGTNFVGSNHELQRMYQLITSTKSNEELHPFLTPRRIRWVFIPGRAPHFGGLWEAGVKAAKTLLRKLLKDQCLTTSEYTTVLVEVEATLNSRPLCPLSSLPEDGVEVLTPGHFLIGRPLDALPYSSSTSLKDSAVKRWNLCQRLSHEFWRRWSTEYIQALQRTHKWLRSQRNLHIGDVVLLKDQESMGRSWPLARVTKTFPGRDGLVRAVEIRTATTRLIRPIHKLVLLVPEKEDTTLPAADSPASLPAGERCSGT